ncbi:MAG: polyprenyl synthetase family protein [Spirochaetota bacterium]
MRSVQAINGPASSRGLRFSEHPFWHDLPEIVPELERVRELVVSEAESAGGPIGDALSRYVARPGKMLRPGFVLIGAWAGRRDPGRPVPDRIVRVAAAIETLHIATLIHDDVIDDADRRRGEPSLHALYGRKQAVLMGDYLLSRCFTMVAEETERENALRLAAATGHLVRGEINQTFGASADRLSRRGYLRRIAGKTAVLFGMSLVTGAAEAKARPRDIAILWRVGYNLGIAFQIVDDILDFTSRSDALGKPVASDLRAGIYTLPVIEAVHRNDELRARVVPAPTEQRAIEEIVRAIRDSGGIRAARAAATAYTDRARDAIRRLPHAEQRRALGLVAEKLLSREL